MFRTANGGRCLAVLTGAHAAALGAFPAHRLRHRHQLVNIVKMHHYCGRWGLSRSFGVARTLGASGSHLVGAIVVAARRGSGLRGCDLQGESQGYLRSRSKPLCLRR